MPFDVFYKKKFIFVICKTVLTLFGANYLFII